MKKIRYHTLFISLIFLIITSAGCKKYLDEKANASFIVPATLRDLQALLDFYQFMNNRDPGSGEVSADNYYLTTTDWNAQSEVDRRKYTWEKDYLFADGSNEWLTAYSSIYTPNYILENIDKIATNKPSDQNDINNIKGQAFFFRAKYYHQAAIIWTNAYDSATALNELGLPLRLNSNFNEVSVRSNLQQTYDQIIADLEQSITLLPNTPVHPMRPSKAAAYGLLSRVYLSMRKYNKAGINADLCLQIKNTLLDYNTLSTTANFITQFNSEVIFHSVMSFSGPLTNNICKIDSVLYNSYPINDLRKVIFFKSNGNGTYRFSGNYDNISFFTGIATDEIYLTRAECFARAGNKDAALADLNALISKRWRNTVTYTPFTATDAADALTKILTERRKELLMRGLRWMDIKRLNKENANIILRRIVNNQTFTLLPNDLKYALPIPEDVIALSGMQQNPR